jgi:arylsulfatase A-like enzyme
MWRLLIACGGSPPQSHPVVEPPPTAPSESVVHILPAQPVIGRDALLCQLDAGLEGTLTWKADGEPRDAPGGVVPVDEARTATEWECTAHLPDGDVSTSVVPVRGGGNVLVLVLDDVGVDKIGIYAEHDQPAPTPHIDSLLAGGVLFRNAWGSSVCSSARAALQTGRHARRTGVGGLIDAWDPDSVPLRGGEVTLPEMLAWSTTDTWTTRHFGKWHLSKWFGDAAGLDGPRNQGYGAASGSVANLRDPDYAPDNVANSYSHWEKVTDGVPTPTDTYATTDTADAAIAAVTSLPPPWLVVAAFNAAHEPIHVPPARLLTVTAPTAESLDVDQMDAMIEALDTEIGRLLASVPPDTTIFLVGDNGTVDTAIRPPWPIDQGKGTMYESGLRVPFGVAGPLVTAPGESAALVQLVDVFPTLAEIAGIDLGGHLQDGASVLRYLADPGAPSLHAVLFAEDFKPNGPGPFTDWDLRAVRDQRFKLVRDAERTRDQIFDLSADPHEQLDLGDAPLTPEQSAGFAALREQMDALTATVVYDETVGP